MGNISSNNVNGRRRHGNRRSHPPPPPTVPPQPEITPNRYVFAAATPSPSPYPNPPPYYPNPPPYYQHPGYNHPPAPAMPAPCDHRHRVGHWVGGRCPMMPRPAPYVENQKAVTVRNDVNLLKESLKLEQDEETPGSYLVTFRFDAAVAGRNELIMDYITCKCDPGTECVICLSEPRDTTVLPCRHMCMCSGCAKVLRFQTNRCPICRQPVDRLVEIPVDNAPDE